MAGDFGAVDRIGQPGKICDGMDIWGITVKAHR